MEWSDPSKIRLMSVVLVAALILALPTASWSQTAEWTVYNTDNSGLPYNGVTGLAVDAQGNIWVGTGKWYANVGGGLAKFDGQNWTVYNTSNSELPNNDHTSLSIDAQGNVWSATENGYARFDGENWSVYHRTNSGLPGGSGGAPVFDAEGNAWIGTSVGGLAKFDGANWTVYNTANSGLPSNRIYSIADFDAQGNLWIGTWGGGLAKFNGQNWTVYNTSNSELPDNTINFLSVDVQDNVWIGTHNNGLAKFDGTNWMVYNRANSGLPNNRIWYIAVSVQGNIWVATGGGGLAKFNGNNYWKVYNISNSGLPHNNVYSITIDAQANVWIGTSSGGLAVYRAGARPTVDFNSDGIVDAADVCIMVEHWLTDYPLCDIGPMPRGDGIIDVQDLKVLAEHLFEEVKDPSLVSHFALDETEGDIASNSANDIDGNVYGDPAWQPEGGMVDGALQLDGIDDYVSTPFLLNPGEPYSVFVWIKGSIPGQVILSHKNHSNWLVTNSTNGSLMTETRYIEETDLRSQAVVTDGQWHRLGLVWNGAHRILYVDDVEVASDTQDRLSGWSSDLYIGAGKLLEPETFFSGLIDDVRIYDRAIKP